MSEKHIGKVIQVIGPVLDIQFKDGELPELLNAIEIDNHGQKLVVEVAQLTGDNVARCISPAYAVFLAAAAVCAVLLCMMYLKLQSDVMDRSESVTALQAELADLTEANDTAYNAAADSVNLKEIKDRAMNDMGMVYASEGTVIEYDSPTGSYVKQYSDIPEDGILAQSKDVSE